MELLVIAGLVAVVVVRIAAIRRAALRAARLRAEAVLDELAAAACAALAPGASPRAGDRAVERYARTRDRVDRARTRRELDAVVARHRLRLRAIDLAERGLERVRAALGAAIPLRR